MVMSILLRMLCASSRYAYVFRDVYGENCLTFDGPLKAARRGVLPRVTRRLNELERRSMIRSGAVFVFSVEESGIKRWTEGLAWSQSRISGNFLVSNMTHDDAIMPQSTEEDQIC